MSLKAVFRIFWYLQGKRHCCWIKFRILCILADFLSLLKGSKEVLTQLCANTAGTHISIKLSDLWARKYYTLLKNFTIVAQNVKKNLPVLVFEINWNLTVRITRKSCLRGTKNSGCSYLIKVGRSSHRIVLFSVITESSSANLPNVPQSARL